jgi:hypothetical protein
LREDFYDFFAGHVVVRHIRKLLWLSWSLKELDVRKFWGSSEIVIAPQMADGEWWNEASFVIG